MENKKRKALFGCVAVVLTVIILLGALLHPNFADFRSRTNVDATQKAFFETPEINVAYVVAKPVYPVMAPYPNENSKSFAEDYAAWLEDIKVQQKPSGYSDGLEEFVITSIKEFLSGVDSENKVYSPLSTYMAIAILAELTAGESRHQILDLLNVDSLNELRKQASDVWNDNYRNDGAATLVLASSLWLNEDVEFVPKTMEILAENYYASSFRGNMGSDDFNKAFQQWLNNETGGLLSYKTDSLEMTKETVMALVSTVYFQGKWVNEYSPQKTTEGTFYSENEEISCDYMYQSKSQYYYWGENFSAISQSLENGEMWFVLPDENISVDDLLSDTEATEFILKSNNWVNKDFLIVNQAVPKFDVTSQADLNDGLKNLGITDVFDASVSDFSPTSLSADGLFISKVEHSARVAIDEKGCTASAYTAMMLAGSPAPPEKEIDFVLDRPFIFVITGESGLPLFVGVVHQP